MGDIIGIDVGGTNTDAVRLCGGQIAARTKVPTTPDIGSGLLAALARVQGRDSVERVHVGTTAFTNALVTRLLVSCLSCGTLGEDGERFGGRCGAELAAPASQGRAVPDRSPCDCTAKHLADKILQSQSALERAVAVNVAAGRAVRFIPVLNAPEDDLGEAVDSVLDLVVG